MLCDVTTNAFSFAMMHESFNSDFKNLRKLCVGLMKDLYKRVELASKVVIKESKQKFWY
jgi:hypothetical protein